MAEGAGADEDSGTNKRSFPRRLGWLLACLALLMLLVLGVSNLWLASGWGRGMVESKLEDRTGFDWQLGSMRWSPWSGCTINELTMLQPEELDLAAEEPLLVIKQIRIQPYWNRLLRGGLRPREIIIDTPEVTVPLELLAALQGEATPPEEPPAPPERPPVLAAHNGGRGQVAAGPSGQPPAGVTNGSGQQPAVVQPQPPKPEPPKAKRPAAGLPMRLQVRDASVRIVSPGNKRDLLQVKRASMDLPLYGEDAPGKLKVTALTIPGIGELPGFEQALVWKRPFIEIEEEAIEVTGLKLRFRSQLAPKQGKDGNFPYFVEGVMDPQQVESVEWLERLGLKLSARKMMARFKLMGLSTNPATWKGELLVLGEGISVGAPQRGQHVVFDVMHFPAALRGGRLYWNGFKMVGEDLSLLGNGRISMSGGIVAVTRLVASPEIAVEMSKGLHNAGIAEDRWWYDFGTPDRQARDLTVSGRLNDPVVDAGPGHANMPLAKLLGPIVESARKKTAVQRTEERTEDARAETLPDHGTTDPENDEDH